VTDPFRSTRDAEFHRALLELPIVRIDTSAPTRIDLAGGTIDIWPLYLLHEGAQTINVAISLRAAARVEGRKDGRIVLHSEDTGQHVEFADWSALRNTRHLRLLGLLVHWFLREAGGDKASGGLTLTIRCESPAGAGRRHSQWPCAPHSRGGPADRMTRNRSCRSRRISKPRRFVCPPDFRTIDPRCTAASARSSLE